MKETNQMIGVVQLHSKDQLNRNCRLGCIIGFDFNGFGYMKEACEKVIDFAFNKIAYHRIEAEVVTQNIRSINLMISLGMKEESLKKESYLLDGEFYDQRVFVKLNENDIKK